MLGLDDTTIFGTDSIVGINGEGIVGFDKGDLLDTIGSFPGIEV